MLYHYVHRLMAKDFLVRSDASFARIIRLYYLSMDHAEVYNCLRLLYAQTGINPANSALCSVIREFYSRPRTLKQMARIVINKCVGGRPAPVAAKLPLPPALREYVMNFEP